jgi:hypothetical protein
MTELRYIERFQCPRTGDLIERTYNEKGEQIGGDRVIDRRLKPGTLVTMPNFTWPRYDESEGVLTPVGKAVK